MNLEAITSKVETAITSDMVIARLLQLMETNAQPSKQRAIGDVITCADMVEFHSRDGGTCIDSAEGWSGMILTQGLIDLHGIVGIYSK